MSRIISSITERFHRLSENQLRIGYALIVIVSLGVNILVSVRTMQDSIVNSDDCLWASRVVDGKGSVVVDQILEGGQADRAGVKKGDIVVSINGGTVIDGNTQQAQRLLDQAPTDRPIPYVVERDGNRITLSINLTKQLNFLKLVVPIVALLWLLVGSMVAFTRPHGRVQQQFFLTGALMIFAFVFPGWLFYSSPIAQVLGLVWGILSVLFFPMWLRFCTTFPVDQEIFRTTGRRLLLNSILIGYVLVMVAMFVQDALGFPLSGTLQQLISFAFLVSATLYFMVGIWFLFRGYRKLSAPADRRPMRVILIGTILAGLAFAFITILRTTTAGFAFILNPQYLFPLLLLLALPISFGYAIFKYQMMDFRVVLKTTVVYTATMALIAGLYLGVAYAISQGLGALTQETLQGPVQFVTFIILALLFEPLKRQVQTTIENRFFPQRRDYSQQLAIYAEQISETVGRIAVAELMAHTLRRALDLRGVYVLIESEIGEFEPLAKSTDFPPLEVEYAAIAELRQLLRESHAIISLETISDSILLPLQEWFSYVVGLYAQGRAIGAVILTRPIGSDSLSSRQMQFISGIVAQGAGSIEVARLYEEELARQRYLEELSTARRIQESLLPTEMPKIPGISISAMARPAQAVGGDYYDVIQLEEGRFLVIIADVSGKGLPASLYMAEFHGMVHVASANHRSPHEILSTLNVHLSKVIARGSFITATMLLFDTARMTVSMARAGHTPIIRRHGGEIDTLIPGGIALGLGPREIFASALQEYTVRYEPGETFILYSDGVSEAMNGARDEFGEGRLLDLISSFPDSNAEHICTGILRRVEEFRAGAEQNDDVTIVVVRIEREASAGMNRGAQKQKPVNTDYQ